MNASWKCLMFGRKSVRDRIHGPPLLTHWKRPVWVKMSWQNACDISLKRDSQSPGIDYFTQLSKFLHTDVCIHHQACSKKLRVANSLNHTYFINSDDICHWCYIPWSVCALWISLIKVYMQLVVHNFTLIISMVFLSIVCISLNKKHNKVCVE